MGCLAISDVQTNFTCTANTWGATRRDDRTPCNAEFVWYWLLRPWWGLQYNCTQSPWSVPVNHAGYNGQKSSVSNSLSDFIPMLREHLSRSGISGWLACRSSIVLLATMVAVRFNQLRRTTVMREIRFSDLIESQEDLMSLWTDVSRFYYERRPAGSGGSLQHTGDLDLLLRSVYQSYFPDLMPKYIRTEEGGDFVAISDLLS